MKKLITLLFTAVLLVTFLSASVNADDNYTVAVDGGLYGTSDSDSKAVKHGKTLTVEIESGNKKLDVKDGSETLFSVSVDNDKYYLKGVHYAGQYLKNEDLIVNIPVNEDLILVASYGVVGDLVAYYATYVDQDGNTLHAEDTFYANDGEKVLLAAKYIDGYTVSNTKSYTGTVSKNAENPVRFEFVYVPEGEAGTTVIDDGTTYIYTEGEGGAGGTGGGAGGGTTPTPAPTPAEIIDIDEPTIPQTEPEPTPTPTPTPEPEPVPEPNESGFWQYLLNHPLVLGGVVAGLGLLAWFFIYLFTRKSNNG